MLTCCFVFASSEKRPDGFIGPGTAPFAERPKPPKPAQRKQGQQHHGNLRNTRNFGIAVWKSRTQEENDASEPSSAFTRQRPALDKFVFFYVVIQRPNSVNIDIVQRFLFAEGECIFKLPVGYGASGKAPYKSRNIFPGASINEFAHCLRRLFNWSPRQSHPAARCNPWAARPAGRPACVPRQSTCGRWDRPGPPPRRGGHCRRFRGC